jgi:hypothetical protein
MKKQQVKMTVERNKDGFWAFAEVKGGLISTRGNTLEDLKNNIVEATNLFFEDKGVTYSIDEIQITFDVQSFFEFYGIVNAKALAANIGMSQSLLAQYAKGIKTPSPKQVSRIMEGVRRLGRELSNLEIV